MATAIAMLLCFASGICLAFGMVTHLTMIESPWRLYWTSGISMCAAIAFGVLA